MAIQIRRGSNAEWEVNNSNIVVGEPAVATDSKRAFIGTASGSYMELANLEAIAPAYDPGNSYMIDDYVSYQGKLYVCTVPTSGAWNASAWQVTSLGQALAENAYSNYETYTMSGDIVSFPNGAGGIPVKDLKAEVEAVQDLHGYDAPWVGGAGKNKLHVTATTTTINGVTFTVNSDGTVTVNGTASATASFTLGQFSYTTGQSVILSGSIEGGGLSTWEIQTTIDGQTYRDNGSGVTITPNSNVTNNILLIIRDGATLTNKVFKPMIRLSSVTDATFAPYSNICPISGWDEVNVNVCGKNLAVDFGNYYTDASGVIQASSSYWSYVVPVDNGQKYTFSRSGVKTTIPVIAYYEDYPRLGSVSYNGSRQISVDGTFMSPVDGYAIIRMQSIDTHDVQVEVGTTASSFEPNGTTYTTDLDGTRYGGTLDVTTGVLTVTHGYVDLGTLTWAYQSANNIFYSGGFPSCKNNTTDMIFSNHGWTAKSSQSGVIQTNKSICKDSNGRLYVHDSMYSTSADFQSAMNGSMMCYELATPQVVQLTATQVRTLLGQNNIWCDSGEIEELTYRISNVQ